MQLLADLHCHTIASGHAFSTLSEMTSAAARRGLDLIAFTDHGPSMDGAPHEGYFTMAARVPRRLDGIIVLFGCEANVLSPDGNLDLAPGILSTLDLVAAGLHERTPYPGDRGLKDNTMALVAACSNPHVDLIVHPYRPRFPVDVDEVATAAAATGTLLEVNASLFRPLLHARAAADSEVVGQTRRMLQVLADCDGRCVVSSDAHSAWELGFEQELIDFLSEVVHLDPELVVNQDVTAVTAHLSIEANSRT